MKIEQQIKPVFIDFLQCRSDRQMINNLKVYNSIKDRNITKFKNTINQLELKRILEFLSIDFKTFWNKCLSDDVFSKLASSKLSKRSSRQGNNDEKYQLEVCNSIASMLGIEIKKLSSVEIRASKNGKIINNKQMKLQNINKIDCLKSFDAELSGVMSGYIFCKVLYGCGGHQDNVFEEINCACEWWLKYKSNSKQYLVILIDTDRTQYFTEIKNKYISISNLLFFNHYQFQEYLIENFLIKKTSLK